MNLRSVSKRVLAVIMSLTLLLSCMVWSGVSAAAATVSTDFTGYTVTVTTDTANYDNAAYAAVVDSGDATYGAAMRLTYTDNSIEKENVGFRFFSGTGTTHQWNNNTTFLVEFAYKVEAVTAAAELRVMAGSKNWESNGFNSAETDGATYWGVAKELAVTATASQWQTAYIVLSGCSYRNRNAIHIYLHSDNPTAQGGTSVLIDNVRVTSGYVVPTVNFDTAGGDPIAPITAISGTADLPVPTRFGYTFEGWYEDAAYTRPATSPYTVPAGETTLYASWSRNATSQQTLTQDFEDVTSVDAFATNTQKPFVLKDLSGNQCLAATILPGYNGNFARPLWALQMKGETTPLQVKTGSEITVSFKIMAERATSKIGYMLDTVNDLSALTANPTSSKNAAPYRTMQVLSSTSHGTLNAAGNEVQNISLTAGEWITVTATIPAIAAHGAGTQYLVLAITDTGANPGAAASWVNYDLHVDDVTVTTTVGTVDVAVTYDTQGGDAMASTTAVAGAPITAVPTRAGYDFDGWYAEAACNTLVTTYPEQATVTLYAGWRLAGSEVMDFELNTGVAPTVFATTDLTDAGVQDYYRLRSNLYSGAEAPHSIVEHDGKTAIKAEYLAGANATTAPYGWRVVGKENAADGFKSVIGTRYSISFSYKVEAMPVSTSVNIIEGSLNWESANPGSSAKYHDGFVLTPQDVGAGWQTGEICFEAQTKDKGIHLVLDALDKTSRGGTVVYFADIVVKESQLKGFTALGATRVENVQNHTPDGKAVYAFTDTANARVLFANTLGDRRFATNTINDAVVWLYADTAADVTLYVYSDPSKEDLTAPYVMNGTAITLSAGQWTRVPVEFGITPVAKETQTYIGFGVTAPAGVTVYMDDVSVAEYPNDSTKVQDYERFIPSQTGTNTSRLDGSIHGLNGSAVVAGKGYLSNQSLQISMQSDVEADVSRTVLMLDKMDATATVGGGYIITFYAMAEEDLQVTFALGTSGTIDLSDRALYATAAEAGATRTVTLTAGEWTPVSVDVAELQGKNPETVLEPYVTLAAWFEGASASNVKNVYVDDVSLKDYVAVTPAREDTLCFEDAYAFGFGKSLYSTSFGAMTVDMDRNHTASGYYSLKVNTDTVAGGTRPQFNLTKSDGTPVTVEAGKGYRVSFWAYLPADAPGNGLRWWLTATDSTVPYVNSDEKDTDVVYESNDTTLTKGSWQQISVTLEDLPRGGYLRLGVCGMRLEDTTFWLDDIRVTNYKNVALTGKETVWDFETYNVEDKEFIRHGTGYVTDEYNRTADGGQSLRLDGVNTSGFDRNQFILIDPATKQPYEFIKGENYTLHFWVYWTDEAVNTFKTNLWIWGTDDPNEEFTTRAEKNDKNGQYEFDGAASPISNEGVMIPNQWNEFKLSFTATNGKYMLVGMTNSAVANGYSYYLDDIEIEKPIPAVVTFDANGGAFDEADAAGLNDKGQYVVKTAIGLQVQGPSIAPYREGKRFMGWATDPEGQNHYPLTNYVSTEALTLYAMWGDWPQGDSYDKIDKDNLTGEKDEIKYKTEIHSERVWTGNAQIPTLQTGDPIETQEADPVTYVPPTKDTTDDTATGGLPVWLIIVIIVAAVVVVGGGALLALLLLKNKKANEKEVA